MQSVNFHYRKCGVWRSLLIFQVHFLERLVQKKKWKENKLHNYQNKYSLYFLIISQPAILPFKSQNFFLCFFFMLRIQTNTSTNKFHLNLLYYNMESKRLSNKTRTFYPYSNFPLTFTGCQTPPILVYVCEILFFFFAAFFPVFFKNAEMKQLQTAQRLAAGLWGDLSEFCVCLLLFVVGNCAELVEVVHKTKAFPPLHVPMVEMWWL